MNKIKITFLVLFALIFLMSCPAYSADVNGKVLVLYGGNILSDNISYGIVIDILALQRIDFDSASIDDPFTLEEASVGLYGVIIITDYLEYQNLEAGKRLALDQYCSQYGVGLFFLYMDPSANVNGGEVNVLPTDTLTNQKVNPQSSVLYVTKDGGTILGDIPGSGRLLVPAPKATGYESIAEATLGAQTEANILLDKGDYDGIKRIFFGSDFVEFWLHDLLFVDCLHYLSPVDIGVSIVRYFSVDIDDIFQPNYAELEIDRTVKIQEEDVDALLEDADQISQYTSTPFKWSLGFNCGWYETQVGGPSYDDVAADRTFVENASEFYWFDHFPNHERASHFVQSEIEGFMKTSLDFAKDKGFDGYMSQYILPPYNDGIYPVYEPMYEAMLTYDYIYTASTWFEEGMMHKGIKVAPRHPSGISSEQYSWAHISQAEIDSMIEGGGLFFRFFHTQVIFFITHQSNFARDQIGNYLFVQLFEFFSKWTNYQFVTGDNDFLVNKYFEIYFGIEPPVTDDDDDDSTDDDDDNNPVPHDDDDDSGGLDDDSDQNDGGSCCG